MFGLGKKSEEEPKKEDVNVEIPNEEEEMIQISKSQYDAIITRFEELDKQLEKGKVEDEDLDSLAEEGRQALSKGATAQEQKDIDSMSNTEVVNYILNQVAQFAQPIVNNVEAIKAQREIDLCKAKHTDFDDYQKEILKIAVANPSLSIERAYHLAVKEAEEKGIKKSSKQEGEDEKGEKRSTSVKILNLPKVKPLGEKNGLPSSAASQGGIMSITEAATKAAREAGLS